MHNSATFLVPLISCFQYVGSSGMMALPLRLMDLLMVDEFPENTTVGVRLVVRVNAIQGSLRA